jgi:flagellar hook-length control protein FliK
MVAMADDPDRVPVEVTLDPAVLDPRPTETRAISDPVSPRADLGRNVATQVIEVLRPAPDGPVEISLSPEELGRVRLSLTGTDGAITVHILAERPETLELMRRHVDMLAADLRAQGYSQIQFDFSGGGHPAKGDGSSQDSPEIATNAQTTAAPEIRPLPPPQIGSGRGLNLRL